MIIDIFLIIYTVFLSLIAAWAAYSSYLVIKCGVPPVPTNRRISRAMIKAAKITENQTVYDLGCGFGDILLEAYKQHPNNRYQGFDINQPVLWIANFRAGHRPAVFHHQDFFTTDLSDADVIFCYLWPSIMAQIETEIWPTLKPDTRLISHGFPLPNVKPVETFKTKRNKVLVYVK